MRQYYPCNNESSNDYSGTVADSVDVWSPLDYKVVISCDGAGVTLSGDLLAEGSDERCGTNARGPDAHPEW